MAGENKISISYSPPPLSFIHRPTVSMIETEGGPVNSDRFLRQNEASNIETNFSTNTNTADVKKTRASATITKPVPMPDNNSAVNKSPKSEMMWDILKQLQSDIMEIRREHRGRSPTRSISRSKKRRHRKRSSTRGKKRRRIESSSSISDQGDPKRPCTSKMTTKKYTVKKGGVQNAQNENPPGNRELQKAGELTDNTKVIAYDINTETGKIINDESVEIYASDNFPSNEDNPESSPSDEERTSVQANDEMTDTRSLQDKEEGSDIYDFVKTVNREEKFENPVNEKWASIINNNWNSQKSGEKMKELFRKYNPPRNCDSLKFPKTDGAVWKALNKYKKKSDLKFIWIQKSLVKAASATLNLNDKILKALGKQSNTAKEIEETKDIKTEILQNTADIIALLGHASNEITLKRKIALSSVIKPEYRSLCYASGTGTDEFVFGQNLENQLKEINVTSKLTTKKQQNGQSINSQTNYQTRGGFLGRGRGQRAQPYQRHQSQQRGKKTHH